MTDQHIPPPRVEWEPKPEGIELNIKSVVTKNWYGFDLPITSVRELRDDMEEAAMLSRGYERLELDVEEIHEGDQIFVLGHAVVVHNLLSGKHYGDEQEWTVQFEMSSFSAIPCEITLPGDQQVTIYRRVS